MSINIQPGGGKGDYFFLTADGDFLGAGGLFGKIFIKVNLLVLVSNQLIAP